MHSVSIRSKGVTTICSTKVEIWQQIKITYFPFLQYMKQASRRQGKTTTNRRDSDRPRPGISARNYSPLICTTNGFIPFLKTVWILIRWLHQMHLVKISDQDPHCFPAACQSFEKVRHNSRIESWLRCM